MSSLMSQNHTHDFRFPLGTLFQEPSIQYYIIYNEHIPGRHWFEQK